MVVLEKLVNYYLMIVRKTIEANNANLTFDPLRFTPKKLGVVINFLANMFSKLASIHQIGEVD